jgi:hypothetical protein
MFALIFIIISIVNQSIFEMKIYEFKLIEILLDKKRVMKFGKNCHVYQEKKTFKPIA